MCSMFISLYKYIFRITLLRVAIAFIFVVYAYERTIPINPLVVMASWLADVQDCP